MNQKKNNFHFDIPIAVIVIALIFSFPVGVLLAFLRLVFPPEKGAKKSNTQIGSEGGRLKADAKNPSGQRANQNGLHGEEVRARTNGKNGKVKHSIGAVLSTGVCIGAFVLGILGVFSVFDGTVQDIPHKLLQYVAPFMTVSGISYLFSLFFE